ncbi:MAG: hypothetical protein AB7F09_08200 [Parvibaculaceae bacterium]
MSMLSGRTVVIAAMLLPFLAIAAAAVDLPPYARYQVDLGKPSANAFEAFQSVAKRATSVKHWNACGEEMEFLANEGTRNAENQRNGDILPMVLGKIAFLGERGNVPCEAEIDYIDEEVKHWKNWPREDNRRHTDGEILSWPDHVGIESPDPVALINAAFKRRFGEACNDVLDTAVIAPDRPDGRKAYRLKFNVSANCLRAEINEALLKREVVGHPGTTGLPCRVLGSAGEGDWDMSLIGLVRMLYVDRQTGANAIEPKTRDYVIANLLTVSGPLEPESYGMFQCGNQERDTGPPQERADESAFYDDGLWDDLGDLLDWFKNFLIVLAVVALALLALFVAIGASAVALSAAILVSAQAVIPLSQIRIPETENHLLMINSSRYLTNQLIIEAITDEDDRQDAEDTQEEVEEWLLQRFRKITREDFIEYNSKPYQRLSIAAILNVHDFVAPEDVELRQGARIVLEFASAKFAAGSNQARRIVPFRRLMEANRHEIWGPGAEGLAPRRIFDVDSASDHQTPAMLFYTGLTQQLPQTESGSGELTDRRWLASTTSVNQMIWEATSSFIPHEIILDLAINKSVPYEQRLHHNGFEIYSSGKGYLITAGGIATDYAYGALYTPFEISGGVPFNIKLKNSDRGTGVPTTLMPASPQRQDRRSDFLRIEGVLREWNHEDRDEDFASNAECEQNKDKAGSPKCRRNVGNDNNLCVRKGFACGTDLVVPPDLEACLKTTPGAPDAWRFINSEECAAYAGAPPFYVVIMRRPCPADEETCHGQWGFFEAVDKPAGLAFADFMKQTVERNPFTLVPSPNSMVGEYNSWRNERVTFNANGHEEDDDESGISGIDGIDQEDIDDWPLAEGDAITADGDGRLTIRAPGRQPAPGLSTSIKIDFTDWEHPKYEVLP